MLPTLTHYCIARRKKETMELELALALPSNNESVPLPSKKRSFHRAFMPTTATLPLFVWEDDDDDDDGDRKRSTNKCEEEDDEKKGKEVVGWPPVKIRRWSDGRRRREGAKCVKVKMEGVGIGRKVDLSLHHSYESLLCALGDMFPRQYDTDPHGARELTVTYEDGEGDWLLVGDVPWEVFLESVKRLKILAKHAE